MYILNDVNWEGGGDVKDHKGGGGGGGDVKDHKGGGGGGVM